MGGGPPTRPTPRRCTWCTAATPCGGGSFGISAAEYEASLRLLAEQERAALPPGVPVHHVPGNHDLDPHAGGLGRWRDAFLGPNATTASPPAPNYRALSAGSWRLLLLDSVDGIDADRDGHGHIGATQLAWLDSELKAAAAAHQQVALLMHQLLVEPVDEYGGGGAPEWLDRPRRPRRQRRRGARAHRAPPARAAVLPRARAREHADGARPHCAFVSLASAGEWPMQWREARLFGCEAELRTHQLAMPALLERSRLRDTRGGRNAAKLGDALDNAGAAAVVLTVQFLNSPPRAPRSHREEVGRARVRAPRRAPLGARLVGGRRRVGGHAVRRAHGQLGAARHRLAALERRQPLDRLPRRHQLLRRRHRLGREPRHHEVRESGRPRWSRRTCSAMLVCGPTFIRSSST